MEENLARERRGIGEVDDRVAVAGRAATHVGEVGSLGPDPEELEVLEAAVVGRDHVFHVRFLEDGIVLECLTLC